MGYIIIPVEHSCFYWLHVLSQYLVQTIIQHSSTRAKLATYIAHFSFDRIFKIVLSCQTRQVSLVKQAA
jgi:hypothetical protein